MLTYYTWNNWKAVNVGDAPTKFRVDNLIYTLKDRPYPMAVVLSEAIDSVKNLLHDDMFPNFIKEINCYLRYREMKMNTN